MTSKRKKIMTLVSFVIAVLMSFSLFAPAIAAEMSTGTDGNPAKAAFTKILRMPVGTTIPDVKFEFEFAKEGVDGDKSVEAKATMPPVANASVTFIKGETATKDDENGVKFIHRETDDIFKDVIWPHAGIYEYIVKEKKDTYTIEANADYVDEMSYTNASYRIVVYVENGTNGLYIAAIAAYIVVLDTTDQGKVGDKVDPTPGGDKTIVGDYSKVVFTNNYLKRYGTDKPDPDRSMLQVSKTVDGGQGDRTRYFRFDIVINNPATVTTVGTEHMAYIKDAAGNIVMNIADNAGTNQIYTDATDRPYLKFTAGSTLTIYLKHGQSLAFIDLPVGASIIAGEPVGVENYTPKYQLTLGNATPTGLEGEKGGDLTIPKSYVAEKNNSIAFTNAHSSVTPAGISVDNLPYIVLLAIGILAFTGYIVVKSRKKFSSED